MKFAGNKDRHKYSDEFDFRPDRSICFAVTRPLVSNFPLKTYNGVNLVDTIAPSFLIGPLLNFQVTRTGMNSRTCSNSGHI